MSADVRRTYLLAAESRRTLVERHTSLTSKTSIRNEHTPQLRHELVLNVVTEACAVPCPTGKRSDDRAFMRDGEALQEPSVSGRCGSDDRRAHTVCFATPGPAELSDDSLGTGVERMLHRQGSTTRSRRAPVMKLAIDACAGPSTTADSGRARATRCSRPMAASCERLSVSQDSKLHCSRRTHHETRARESQ